MRLPPRLSVVRPRSELTWHELIGSGSTYSEILEDFVLDGQTMAVPAWDIANVGVSMSGHSEYAGRTERGPRSRHGTD